MQETWNSFPQQYREQAHAVLEVLRKHDRFIVCAHASPDGDAVGSTAMMASIVKALGKQVIIYNASGLPDYLRWLPQPCYWHTHLSPLPFTPEVAIVLDCGEAHRTGEEMASSLAAGLPCINIDHHRGNPLFGTVANWVDPDFAATAQAIAYIAQAAGLALTGDIAKNLGLALLTDTGGFAHGNTNVHVLALVTHLVGLGLDIPALREQLDHQWSLGRMRLWGKLMGSVALRRRDTIAFIAIPYSLFQETGATKEDLEGFVDMMRRLKGVKATIMLREDKPKLCKFSLRSAGDIDVRAAAASLNGGGHKNAAGGTIKLPLPEAAEAVVQAVSEELDQEGE